MAGQVAAPSANPSGGLAFGYTFTLTDNFTAAAEKIALSFETLEKASIASAARVSASMSQMVGSAKGLKDVTTDVNSLAKAFERLAKAKKSAGVSSSVETMKKQSTSSADSATKEAEKAAAQATRQAKKQESEREAAQKAADIAARKKERAIIAENKAYEQAFEKELRKEQKKISEQKAADKAKAIIQRKTENAAKATEKAYEKAFAKELQKEKEVERGIRAAAKLQEGLDKKAQKSADSATKEAARAAEKATKEAARQAKTQESERKAAEKASDIAQRKVERGEAAAIKAAERVTRREEYAARVAANKVKREEYAEGVAKRKLERESRVRNDLSSNIERSDNDIGSIMQGLGTMYLGASLFKPLLYSIKVSDEFERAQVRLKGLLGSDSAARGVLNNVKMDAKNDFLLNSKDLLNANTNLISEGASTERARKMANDVSTLVQVSGGTVLGFTNSMKGIARIMGSNKITGVQANRLQTANIPMNHYFEEFTGKSMYKNGRIATTAEEFFKVIGMAAEKYKSVANEMKYTVTGLESMVSEGTTYIMAEFGKINSVVYKKLLIWLDNFTTQLMIFTQTPIGNLVVKILSASLAFAALSVTILGFRMAAVAVMEALAPMAVTFAKTAVTGLVVYKMLQSNSESFVALGLALSTFLGSFGYMFAAVNLAWRAWQTFNDVTEESYGKMSSLNQMFARAGGYIEAFGEILSTINGKEYGLSESLIMKLKSIGAFEGVLKLGSFLLKVYNALKKIYEVGSWVVNLFDGYAGYAIVWGILGMRLMQFILAFTKLLEILSLAKGVFAALSLSTFPFKAGLMQVTIAIAALGLAWKLTTYLFDNWGSINFVQKLMGVLGVLGLLTIAIYAIGTAFGIAAITEFAFLAPLLAICAAVALLILGISELVSYFDRTNPIPREHRTENSEDSINASSIYSIGSVIPRNFDNDMSTQRELSRQRYSPIPIPISQSDGTLTSQDINVNVHYDGDLIYRSMRKKGSLEDTRTHT